MGMNLSMTILANQITHTYGGSVIIALVASTFFYLPAAPPAGGTPSITGSLNDGSTVVTGSAQAKDGVKYSDVKIYLCSAPAVAAGTAAPTASDCSATGKMVPLSNGDGSSVETDANGVFAATLSNKMTSGAFLWVQQMATPAGGGNATAVFSVVQTVGAAAKFPTIQLPVKDNQNPIVGTATPSVTGSTPVQVQLLIKGSDGNFSPQGGAENVGTDGTYTLHETVTLGQTIEVKQLSDSSTSAPAVVQAPDNERQHIDFFAGTVISQGESNFAQADTFLALNVDRALVLPGNYATTPNHHMGFNSFFQARLTTIPVNATTTTSTTTTTGTSTGTATPAHT